MRKYLCFLIIIVTLVISLSVVSSADYNETTNCDDVSESMDESSNNADTSKGIVKETNTVSKKTSSKARSVVTDSNETNDELYDMGCSSTVIQGKDSSAISFRRDSAAKVNIFVKHNTSLVKQYKDKKTYFFHVIVTKDGWVVGHGGTSDDVDNYEIENLSMSMISSNTISTSKLKSIFNIKSNARLGHYVIKAPNGTYALYSKYKKNISNKTGVLNVGDYLVVPNNPGLVKKGNIKNIGFTSIADASRYLSAHDRYGTYRRQIITYYYKRSRLNSTVTVYVTNDNGKYVGLRQAQYVDNIRTNAKYYPSTQIPVLDRYMKIDDIYFQLIKIKTRITVNNINTNSNIIPLKAKVIDEFGNPVNDISVSFKVGDKVLKNSKNAVIYVPVKNGIAQFNYVPSIWNGNLNFSYSASFAGNYKMDSNTSKIANVSINPVDVQTNHVNVVKYCSNISIVTKVKYLSNDTGVTGGNVYYKIDDVVVKNTKHNKILVNVKNGEAKFNLGLSKKHIPKNYKITVVYTNGKFKRETNTYVTIKNSSHINVRQGSVNVITDHASEVPYCSNLSIVTRVNYISNSSGLNKGGVYYKINSVVVKNSLKNSIIVNVKEGIAKFNLNFNKKYKPKEYKITVVYTNGNITEESNTFVTITNQSNIKNNSVADTVKVVTKHDKNVSYCSNLTIVTKVTNLSDNSKMNTGSVYFKIDDEIVKNSNRNKIVINVKEGIVKFNLVFSEKYKPKKYKITSVYTNGNITKEKDTYVTIQ